MILPVHEDRGGLPYDRTVHRQGLDIRVRQDEHNASSADESYLYVAKAPEVNR